MKYYWPKTVCVSLLAAVVAFACGTEDKTTGDKAAAGPAPTTTVDTVVLPGGTSTPGATPSGWDTSFSQRLEIKLLAQYDSSGDAAWDASKHPLVYITTNGPGYGGFLSTVKAPGMVVIDADTYEVIIEKQFEIEGLDPKFYNEDHGVVASPDGKFLYLPTADTSKPVSEAGRIFIINARTLKLHQILQTNSNPHHFKTVNYYDGTTRKDWVLGENFNWQIPGRMGPGSM